MVAPALAEGVGGSDARADEESAALGGWWSQSCPPVKAKCFWFSVRIRAEQHAWAFDRGSPQRRISSLELLATVYLVHLAGQWGHAGHAHFSVRGIPDSACNSFALLRLYSKKLPGALVHMELAAVCESFCVFSQLYRTAAAVRTHGPMIFQRKGSPGGRRRFAGFPGAVRVITWCWTR